MGGWFLNPALTRFRIEVNARWPRRDKTSDGTIGDLAHQGTDSDHNPDPDGSVDAWDMDVNGVDVAKVIDAALHHESIQYVIYNRKITSRNKPGGLGTWHPYTGKSPHTEHVHFNTRTAYERSTKPWFTEAPMEHDPIDADDVASISGGVAKTFNQRFGFPVGPIGGPAPVNWATVAADVAGIKTALNGLVGKAFTDDDAAALRDQIEASTQSVLDAAMPAIAADIAAVPERVRDALATGDPANLATLLAEVMTPGAWAEFVAAVGDIA